MNNLVDKRSGQKASLIADDVYEIIMEQEADEEAEFMVSLMSTIKMPFADLMPYFMCPLGLPPPHCQETSNPFANEYSCMFVVTCKDIDGVCSVQKFSAMSSENAVGAKNLAALALIRHLIIAYKLIVEDFNYQELCLYKTCHTVVGPDQEFPHPPKMCLPNQQFIDTPNNEAHFDADCMFDFALDLDPSIDPELITNNMTMYPLDTSFHAVPLPDLAMGPGPSGSKPPLLLLGNIESDPEFGFHENAAADVDLSVADSSTSKGKGKESAKGCADLDKCTAKLNLQIKRLKNKINRIQRSKKRLLRISTRFSNSLSNIRTDELLLRL